ncbi:hypothetical protein SS1G_14015 [Sclerotinia sclerotiorum 1980 UF-70]|uniref:Rhodopsin domain-containing protein n=1 Tax=Sclerotinia sclerotiorum (strain ATCC 18683 / 1980 / Ss-1) TaxID=665079 RepID=A7F8T4_SCLS1|nr:hypothetical protein SS1G_14015 [Sclerotinia sclerotiorum 1980 UF-70]EDN99155.1 hypothetical protein SS1G_14015 [Sclerotinia sclerotiorum 1980 UF-70]
MATSAVDVADLPHDSRQSQAFALTFVFPIIATIALALRLYSRSLTRSFAADDWVICFAMTELLYNPILALVKTSILLFLLRLTGQKTDVRLSIIGLLIFNGIMMVVTFLLTTFHCVPIAANWYPELYPDAVCMNFANFVTGTASVSVLTDVLALWMPTWIVYNLQIPRSQKIMLVAILSFGLVTVIIGIIRIVLLDTFDRNPPADLTYSILFCVSTIEVGLSFVCACAPALKPIIVRIIPKIFGESSRSRSAKRSTEGNGQGRTGRRPEGYEMSRRTAHTEIEVGDIGGDYDKMSDITDAESGKGKVDGTHKGQMNIAVRTETEVRWHDNVSVSNGKPVRKSGSSTESLV